MAVRPVLVEKMYNASAATQMRCYSLLLVLPLVCVSIPKDQLRLRSSVRFVPARAQTAAKRIRAFVLLAKPTRYR